MRIVAMLLVLVICVLGYSQTDDLEKSFTAGIQAFQDRNINAAILHFENLLNKIDNSENNNYGTVLYCLGNCYANISNFEKACMYLEQAISISKNDPTLIINVYPILLDTYCNNGKSEKASLIVQQMEKLLKEQKVGNLYWSYAVALLSYYQTISDYAKAVKLSKYVQSAETYIEEMSEQDSLNTIIEQNSFYMGIALCYEKIGNNKMALESWMQALNYICARIGQNIPTIYSHIGSVYNKLNDKTSALKYYLKSLDNWNKYDENYDNLRRKAQILMQIGVLYQQTSTPIAAISYLEKAKKIYLEVNDTEYLPYTYAYLYICNQSIGDIEESSVYADLLLGKIDEVDKLDDEQFLICYSAYGSILENQGNYKDAISSYQKVIDKKLQLYGANDMRLFSDYYKLATLYFDLSDIDNSIGIINKALILANNFTDRAEEQLLAKFHLVEIDRLKGNLGKAISDCENLKKQVILLNDSSTAKSSFFAILGGLYGEIGAYDKQLDASIKNCEATLKSYGENSPHYAMALLNLSEAYAVCNMQTKATESNTEAVVLLKSIYGEKSIQYYTALHKLGSRYTESNSNKTLDIYADCMNLSKELYGEKSKEYADDILMYYRTLILQNPYEIENEDVKQYIKGINIKREIGMTNDNSYFVALSLLSAFYHVRNDYENMYLTDKEYYEKAKEYIKENFVKLIEWQRDGLWKHFQSGINSIPLGASDTNIPAYNKLAYNCALLNKALLLTSTISLNEMILNSNNESLKELHQKILNLKVKLQKIKDATLLKQKEQELNDLQRKEMNQIKELGEFLEFIDCDWNDVKNALKPKEAAIEFVSFPTQDCVSYAALVITHESMHPIIYPLFNDKEFEKYSLNKNGQMEYNYANPNMYRIVWDRLNKYALNGIKTIYFSPDGLLHKMPIESLRHFNGKGFLCDERNFYRLSSTRELVKVRKERNNPNVVLYGGLDYDTKVLDTIRYMIEDYSLYTSTRSIPDSIGLNREYGTLTATLPEVLHIDSLYSIVNIPSTLYVGQDGTESSFKQLSGKKISNLHIATHGFYWKESELKNNSDLRNLSFITGDNLPIHIEDKAMIRSGLLFSGVNAVLSGDTIPDLHEDGILTAQEISTLDFRGLDLLVLSACQTGLGEIKGDGVFGLQRGFKKAGAQTIIMSLWNVDDNATQMLMTEFYKNLISGLSKRESFIKAQNAVRNFKGIINGESRDFSNPKYWAAFIMLDGID